MNITAILQFFTQTTAWKANLSQLTSPSGRIRIAYLVAKIAQRNDAREYDIPIAKCALVYLYQP